MARSYFKTQDLVECGFPMEVVAEFDYERDLALVKPEFVGIVAEFMDRLFPRRPEILGAA